jgi:hypothetical protein
VLAYPKAARAYFALMELLMRSHTAALVELDPAVLRHLCALLTEVRTSRPQCTSYLGDFDL